MSVTVKHKTKKSKAKGEDQGTIVWDWRAYFHQDVLKNGERDFGSGRIVSFEADPRGSWAEGDTVGGFHVRVSKVPTDYEEYLQYPTVRDIEWGVLSSTERSGYWSCNCSQGSLSYRCRHVASLMFKWESIHGPFVMAETEEGRKRRLEMERLQQEKEEKEKEILVPSVYFLEKCGAASRDLFFQPDTILKNMSELRTNRYQAETAEKLLRSNIEDSFQAKIVMENLYYGQVIEAEDRLYCEEESQVRCVHMKVSREKILNLNCSCSKAVLDSWDHWGGGHRLGFMCAHALVAWYHLRDYIVREQPGDMTDMQADRLLERMADPSVGQAEQMSKGQGEETARTMREDIELLPRIAADRNDHSLSLCFDIRREGGKSFALKRLQTLVDAVKSGASFEMSKTLTINFTEEYFTPSTEKWYRLVEERVQMITEFNKELENSYYYHNGLSAGSGIPFQGKVLDTFYELAHGESVLYQSGQRTSIVSVPVGEASPKAQVDLGTIMNGEDKPIAVILSGKLPRLMKGVQSNYFLDKDGFGRVTDKELVSLRPLEQIAGRDGEFHCVIGNKRFPDFFFRVLPKLRESRQIEIINDYVGDVWEDLLPPEPVFTFFVDLDSEGRATCRAVVTYDDAGYDVGFDSSSYSSGGASVGRDLRQEERVLKTVRKYFSDQDREKALFVSAKDDAAMLAILSEGVRELGLYGEVKGSSAFLGIKVRPPVVPRISVQMEDDLLDLTIVTKDLSQKELLEILASYRLKRSWHRLKNGDFVDLRDLSGIRKLDEMAASFNVTMEDMIKGGVKMPSYRALYVDRLLEDHDSLAASRDRHFKSLIRSFQTIKDSDYEAPLGLEDVLRPYQLYGFRWLATLSTSGFGGILADEMGLGKTLQLLSYIQYMNNSGEKKPSLVVCPASLVYNWKEECGRFVPDLSVETVAGTLKERKLQIADIASGKGAAALYVTSYDLLKRDIALYDGVSFSVVALDEAQYVKNQKAAVSKTVKVLKADHRFALTGTPIENRLSELWSIFDFLMPGFLYTSSEFSERFETPIMKQKNADAMDRLSKMTSPFILRRKKEDVLKDLPEKIEEVQTAVMAQDQRRLYDAQVVKMRELLVSSGDSGEDKMRILAEITRLRQLCCDPSLMLEDYKGSSTKREACLDLVQSAIDGGHRMLVFSQFTTMLDLLAEDLDKEKIPYYMITGATAKKDRLRLVNEFNEGNTPVFLISLKAGGTGLNLVGADVVIHYDPWWNIAVQNQATDRAHRIGQTRQVTVVKLIAAETIEEKIVRMQEAKRDLAEAIIGGEGSSLMSLSREELLELLA